MGQHILPGVQCRVMAVTGNIACTIAEPIASLLASGTLAYVLRRDFPEQLQQQCRMMKPGGEWSLVSKPFNHLHISLFPEHDFGNES